MTSWLVVGSQVKAKRGIALAKKVNGGPVVADFFYFIIFFSFYNNLCCIASNGHMSSNLC